MNKFTIIILAFVLLLNTIQIQAQFHFSLPGSGGTQPHSSRQYHRLSLAPTNAVGPESIAFDCQGQGPYVGVSDGRILKWQGSSTRWTQFAVTTPYRLGSCDGINPSPSEQICGRPLGLKFDNKTCELYITDSTYGLLKVGGNGGVATSLATSAEGISFRFLNALDIDSDTGVVYFSETSSLHSIWEYQAIGTSDRTGRLMKYDPNTKAVTVLLRGLTFANGVALSKNKDFVLVTETTFQRVRQYWLQGPRAGTSEIFMQLNGQPDNINRNDDGDFWIAQNPSRPVKVDESGRILETLETDVIVNSSDVCEINNHVWIGSVDQPYVVYTS